MRFPAQPVRMAFQKFGVLFQGVFSMATVWGLAQELDNIGNELAQLEAGGLVGVELEEKEKQLYREWFEAQENFDQRIDYFVEKIRKTHAAAEYQESRMKHFEARMKREEGKAFRLHQLLKAVMEGRGMTQLETKDNTLWIQKAGGVRKLNITGEVPAEFTKTKTEVLPDSEKIRAVLATGISLDFAKLEPQKDLLRIK